MRRLLTFAAGLGALLAALALRRRGSARRERVDLYFDDGSKTALQVVEDEADRRLGRRRRGDRPLLVPYEEHTSLRGRDLELRERLAVLRGALGSRLQLACCVGERVAPRLVGERRAEQRPVLVEHHRCLDLRRDLRQIGECLGGVHRRDTLTE